MNNQIILAKTPQGNVIQVSKRYPGKIPEGSEYVVVERETLSKYDHLTTQWKDIVSDYNLEIHIKGSPVAKKKVDHVAQLSKDLDVLRTHRRRQLQKLRQGRFSELDVLFYRALENSSKNQQEYITRLKNALRNWNVDDINDLTDAQEIRRFRPSAFDEKIELPKPQKERAPARLPKPLRGYVPPAPVHKPTPLPSQPVNEIVIQNHNWSVLLAAVVLTIAGLIILL